MANADSSWSFSTTSLGEADKTDMRRVPAHFTLFVSHKHVQDALSTKKKKKSKDALALGETEWLPNYFLEKRSEASLETIRYDLSLSHHRHLLMPIYIELPMPPSPMAIFNTLD